MQPNSAQSFIQGYKQPPAKFHTKIKHILVMNKQFMCFSEFTGLWPLSSRQPEHTLTD